MSKVSKYASITALAGAVALAAMMAASPAQAAHKTIESQFQHIEECLKWLTSDPAKHAKNCGPGHTIFFGSINGNGHYTPPVVEEEPCEDPCWHPCWHPCWSPCEEVAR